VTPTLSSPDVLAQPFAVQVQRGEAEAYALTVNTARGFRFLRLIRRRDYTDDHGRPVWCAHPHNSSAHGLDASDGGTPDEAVSACLAKIGRAA